MPQRASYRLSIILPFTMSTISKSFASQTVSHLSAANLSAANLSAANPCDDAIETAALVSPLLAKSPEAGVKLAADDNTPKREGEPLRLGVMASGSGSNFEAIAAAIQSGQLNATIELVIYNNPGAKVAKRAERLDISAELLDHRTFDSREALDDAIAARFHTHSVDWVIMAGWMRRVTDRLLSAFPQRILNIHPSLLPSFPGIRSVEQALNAGVKITGCSVHVVELVVDSGPIIMQAAVPVLPGDSVETLQARIQVQEHVIFPQAIAIAANQQLNQPQPGQNHVSNTDSTITHIN